MPHVMIKMFPGRSEQQKVELTEQIVKDFKEILHSSEDSISVSIEEVAPESWNRDVYTPDIRQKWDQLYKKPGYQPS